MTVISHPFCLALSFDNFVHILVRLIYMLHFLNVQHFNVWELYGRISFWLGSVQILFILDIMQLDSWNTHHTLYAYVYAHILSKSSANCSYPWIIFVDHVVFQLEENWWSSYVNVRRAVWVLWLCDICMCVCVCVLCISHIWCTSIKSGKHFI